MAVIYTRPLVIGAMPTKPRAWLDAMRDGKGVAALEFALVAPVLLAIMFGMFQFGITLVDYLTLTDAVRVGERVLATDRGSTTPWTDARNAVFAAAPNLTPASIGIALTVNGSPCSADTTCQTFLTTAEGDSSSLTASYPCKLTIMGINYAPSGCTLNAATSERVE